MTDTTSAEYVTTLSFAEPSDWVCYLVGKPGKSGGLVMRPEKGNEPNAFWRLMQFLILGFTWVKDPPKP